MALVYLYAYGVHKVTGAYYILSVIQTCTFVDLHQNISAQIPGYIQKCPGPKYLYKKNSYNGRVFSIETFDIGISHSCSIRLSDQGAGKPRISYPPAMGPTILRPQYQMAGQDVM